MNPSIFSYSEQIPEGRRGVRAVAHTAVEIEDNFWASRLRLLRERTIPVIYEQFRNAGHFEIFRQPWQEGRRIIPYVFWESELSKWIEAASYCLATQPDPAIEAMVDEVIAYLASFQQPNGYLNTWFTAVEPQKRWTNLRDWHELYCAGHLIEAAVAHFQATGKRNLLDIVCRYADYIDSVLGDEEGKRRGYCGHQEIELALVKLYRATGEERYLRLSQYFVEERGKQPHYFDAEARARGEEPGDFWARTYEYNQSHVPVREQHEVVGHAVRAMYFYSALADLAKELPDEALFHLCERFWQHLSSKRVYLIGGLGSSADNEGMTADYDLPNDTAYAETCASIGLVLWSHRMLQLDTDGRYADTLERALYNGVLSGLSLDGESFFYVNPLESRGNHHRQPWYTCACCPPNIARLLASLGQYVYGLGEKEVMVHLYVQSTGVLSVGGQRVVVRQQTNYPWDGVVELSLLEMEEASEFAMNLRVPGWSREARLTVNGEEIPVEEHLHKGYVRIEKKWEAGDTIRLELGMAIERVYAHPNVYADAGCVALQRGPLVYCLETADNAIPLHSIQLAEDAALESHFDEGCLGGVVVIGGNATTLETEDWAGALYRTTPARKRAHRLIAVPYYAWDNREPGEMRVWIRTGEA